MISSWHSDAKQAVSTLNTNVKNVIELYESHKLTINTDKTEFVIFCKSSKNAKFNNIRSSVKDQNIKISKSQDYSRVFLDQNLTYQDEVKNIWRKMACGTKSI